jgi:hypothetical protein
MNIFFISFTLFSCCLVTWAMNPSQPTDEEKELKTQAQIISGHLIRILHHLKSSTSDKTKLGVIDGYISDCSKARQFVRQYEYVKAELANRDPKIILKTTIVKDSDTGPSELINSTKKAINELEKVFPDTSVWTGANVAFLLVVFSWGHLEGLDTVCM